MQSSRRPLFRNLIILERLPGIDPDQWRAAEEYGLPGRTLIQINDAAMFETSLAYRRKEGRMRAIDVMTSQIVTATPQTTVQDAAKLMINNRIRGLPIVDADRQLVGIITEGDLLLLRQ